MPTDRDAQQLLHEAANAPSLAEARRLVGEAELVKTALVHKATQDREVDLAQAIVRDHLTPVSVFEHHTAATDWLGEIDTTPPEDMDHQILAQASLWYGNVHPEVKSFPSEFAEQARGKAHKLAGAYGPSADAAEELFLGHVAACHAREVKAGVVKLAVEAPTAPDTSPMPSGSAYEGLPENITTSERAPAIQALEQNNGAGGATDVVPINDPGLGAADTQVDRTNNDLGDQSVADLTSQVDRTSTASRHVATKGIPTMQHAQCPTCGGHGRVAVRVAPQPTIVDIVRMGVSGLDQVDQIVDPHDNGPDTNPAPGQAETYPTDVAFPWTMSPANVQQTISENQQQLAEREQRKGASLERTARKEGNAAYRAFVEHNMKRLDPGKNFDPQHRHVTLHQAATQFALKAYAVVKRAGTDDSGWIGDMGAGGYSTGEQDWNESAMSGANNLQTPDPVYGWGGDNPSQPLKPYGADEADDATNNPDEWAPGQPTQMDMGGRGQATNGAPAPGFPNAPMSHGASVDSDPKLQELLALARRRRAFLESKQNA
jgi:hypothetical protein